MTKFRVPYPREAERRRALFDKALAQLSRFGSCVGDTESGSFQGSTPIGGFAVSYHSPEGADEIEVVIHKKPWMISMAMVESEARKFIGRA